MGLLSKKSHLVFVIDEVRGHLNPSLSLAQELVSRGHKIDFVGRLDGKSIVEEQNISYLPAGEEMFPLGRFNKDIKEIGELTGIRAFQRTIQAFKETNQYQLECLPGLIRELNPDLLVVDQSFPTAAAVADACKIPYVTICNAIDIRVDSSVPPPILHYRYKYGMAAQFRNRLGNAVFSSLLNPALKPINEFRQKHRLAPYRSFDESNSKILILSQQTDDFEFPRPRDPITHHVGPLASEKRKEIGSFPWHRIGEGDFLYASMGTIQNQCAFIYKLIGEVCAGLGIKAVISTGGGVDISQFDIEESVIFVNYAPQLALIKKAKAVITHAGMNTAMEALKFGKPMVAIPITNDQPGVAARIEHSGAGIMIPVKRVTKKRLKNVVERIWHEDKYRNSAQQLRDSIQKAGGCRRAADLIESQLNI